MSQHAMFWADQPSPGIANTMDASAAPELGASSTGHGLSGGAGKRSHKQTRSAEQRIENMKAQVRNMKVLKQYLT